MVGMGSKQGSKTDRMLFGGMWASLLLLGVLDIMHKHDGSFLALLTMAVAVMAIAREIFSA